jgi:hypothetical protein
VRRAALIWLRLPPRGISSRVMVHGHVCLYTFVLKNNVLPCGSGSRDALRRWGCRVSRRCVQTFWPPVRAHRPAKGACMRFVRNSRASAPFLCEAVMQYPETFFPQTTYVDSKQMRHKQLKTRFRVLCIPFAARSLWICTAPLMTAATKNPHA